MDAPESSSIVDKLHAITVHAGYCFCLAHNLDRRFHHLIVADLERGTNAQLSGQKNRPTMEVEVRGLSCNCKFLPVAVVACDADLLLDSNATRAAFCCISGDQGIDACHA